MLALSPLTFNAPLPALMAGLLVLAVLIIARLRKPAMNDWARSLILGGLVILVLAAGDPILHRPRAGEVAVMIDRSPSTRGAMFLDRDRLLNRLDQLMGSVKYRLVDFSNADAQQTIYEPPAADAIVLFSDGRFDPPATSPPTFAVIDPELEHPQDGAVTQLELRDRKIIATVRNEMPSRQLHFARSDPSSQDASSGVHTAAIDPHGGWERAWISPPDAWPENDELSIRLPQPAQAARWWIGRGDMGDGWRTIAPLDLPTQPLDFLEPAIIVLNNISTADLTSVQQDRLEQYVRDLGGSLLILGGDHAFGAGAYDGSRLDALSPLASSPPLATTHWMLLTDASGSMAEPIASSTRWQIAAGAIVELLRQLPPDDALSVGSFARDLRWWSAGRSVRDTMNLALPPRDLLPQGPTNLAAALSQIGDEADSKTPKRLLIITDGETEIPDAAALATSLKTKNVKVHLLAIGHGQGMAAIETIVQQTGGSSLEQFDPQQWAESLRQLYRQASPIWLSNDPLAVRFKKSNASLKVAPWNRTWLKAKSEMIAQSVGDDALPMAASWAYGAGVVTAIAFSPERQDIAAMTEQFARPPSDPRLAISWNAGRQLSVTIDAAEGGKNLNGLQFSLDLFDGASGQRESHAISQTGPGRYAIALPAPRAAIFATVRQDDRTIARQAIAGRYAAEFDAIGNDHAALRDLAQRTGGAVIEPAQTSAIDFHWPARPVRLLSVLASFGAALIAAGLIAWKARA